MKPLTLLESRLRSFADGFKEESIALSDVNGTLSYRELIESVTKISQWLVSNDITTIAVHADNSIDWVVVDLACQQSEIICIPLPVFFSQQQLQNCLNDTLVDLLFTNSAELFADIISQHEIITSPCSLSAVKLFPESKHRDLGIVDQRCPTHTQKITFTSGSTGKPKGVCLSAEHQWATAKSLAGMIEIDNPKHLCLLPLATLLENIAGVYAPLLSHGSVVLPSGIERGLNGSSSLDINALLTCISKEQPNTLILIPELLSALIAACQQGWVAPQSLKFIAVGGAKVSSKLLTTAQNLGLPAYEGYGLSECCSVIALNTPRNNRSGKVGKLLPHCKVATVGENIVVLEPVFQGYYDDRESWYQREVYTQDLGTLKEDYLEINGRIKNVMISSYGRNINPEWVESELLSQPLLSRCVVLGDGRPHLIALLSAPEFIKDNQIHEWVASINSSLPDYARILNWLRLPIQSWNNVLTANGRPQRHKMDTFFEQQINTLYQP